MNSEKRYWVLAYYCFTSIENPAQEVLKHKTFFENRDISSRIYIAGEGINGQMSGLREDALAYMEWMHEDPRFSKMEFKVHEHHENAFPRKTVKVRKHLVALDHEVDISKTGEHLSPKRWKEMLESEEEALLIDVRNSYESKVGHFENAILPQCETFREFPQFAKELKEKCDPKKTKVMMYCTGGIRCELYSALLKEEGFDSVYQLDGGVIKYGLEEGSKHWVGKLFVFDDRLTVPISQEENSHIVGSCHHCGKLSDTYYNCANMDCNELFLSCPQCLAKFKGCCQESCCNSQRLRAFQEVSAHKPFRRKHLLNP